MEPLSEAIAVIVLWCIREFVGGKIHNKRQKKEKQDLKDLIYNNSKHIEENKTLLAKIKNRIH